MNEQEKIIDALKTIQNVCEKKHGICSRCALGDKHGRCLVIDGTTPDEWNVQSPQNTVWRALR
jgi:hypothetical protein